jgi:hypothetical protein
MCLLALRQDIPRKRNLSNDFTNLPLPAGNTKPVAPTALCKIPSGRNSPIAGWLLLCPYCLYTIPSSSGKQALTYTRR